MMIKTLAAVTAILFATAAAPASAGPVEAPVHPTIVLVHGAFADSSGWAGVLDRLRHDGYPVVAAPNQLRSVAEDSASVAGLLKTIKGPIVLVGHSYGGVVISNAAVGDGAVKALVYVAAFAPEIGESASALTAKFPGSKLGEAIKPAPLPDGADLYIRADRFRAVFVADASPAQAILMAETQRPVTQTALTGASTAAAWKTIPSWFIYGDNDLCIPPVAHAFMADRAHARKTVVVKDGSHALMIMHSAEVAKIIELAAE